VLYQVPMHAGDTFVHNQVCIRDDLCPDYTDQWGRVSRQPGPENMHFKLLHKSTTTPTVPVLHLLCGYKEATLVLAWAWHCVDTAQCHGTWVP
jgi:hypothetical protein